MDEPSRVDVSYTLDELYPDLDYVLWIRYLLTPPKRLQILVYSFVHNEKFGAAKSRI